MLSQPETIACRVHQVGTLASSALNDGAEGRVFAIFESSFYVELDGCLVCIGNGAMTASPLNLLAAVPSETNWPASGVRLGAAVGVSGRTIRIGNLLRLDLGKASIWSPGAVKDTWCIDSLRSGLAAFRLACAGLTPNDGLASFVAGGEIGPDEGPLTRAAAEPISALSHWLTVSLCQAPQDHAPPPEVLQDLIGLGPGLTPSGDDLLGGVMIMLHSLGERDLSNRLWSRLAPWAAEIGNPISLAHLEAASQGLGCAAVHDAVAAMMEYRTSAMCDVIEAIGGVGHSSGWDALAGLVIGLDAWFEAHDKGQKIRTSLCCKR